MKTLLLSSVFCALFVSGMAQAPKSTAKKIVPNAAAKKAPAASTATKTASTAPKKTSVAKPVAASATTQPVVAQVSTPVSAAPAAAPEPVSTVSTQPTPAKAPESTPKTSKAVKASDGGYVGIKAGLNYTTITPAPDPSEGSYAFSPGFHVGVLFNAPLGNTVSFQPEILYNSNAIKLKTTVADATLKFGTVDIPLLFKFSSGGSTQFFVTVGPTFSYVMNAKIKVNGQTIDGELSDASFSQRAWYAGSLGIGATFNRTFFVEARGNYFLGDFDEGFYKSGTDRQIMGTFSVGYLFGR